MYIYSYIVYVHIQSDWLGWKLISETKSQVSTLRVKKEAPDEAYMPARQDIQTIFFFLVVSALFRGKGGPPVFIITGSTFSAPGLQGLFRSATYYMHPYK